ncbi:hypothetical protein HDU67_004164, partial [Dinochytrium kinnereticum]
MVMVEIPRYKDPVHIGDASALWIDRAIVEKFSYRPEMFPFEVVDRRSFLRDFEKQQPELRSAMCAFAAQSSLPRAPPGVMKRYYDEARRLCLESVDRPSIQSMQALLIIALTSIGIGKVVPGFAYIAMAVRMIEVLKITPSSGEESPEDASEAAAEHLRILSVLFLVDRTAASITGRKAYLKTELSDLQTAALIEQSLLRASDSNSDEPTIKMMSASMEIADLLYIIKKEAEVPLNSFEDFYDRKERLLLIESKLEDWKTFLPPSLDFESFIRDENFSKESFFSRFALAQVFFFAMYHLSVCLLHRPRIRLKRLLLASNPTLSSNPDLELNRRLIASCTKAYASAQALQFLLLAFRTQQVTPFDQDPIIGFCILVSSLTFVELILVTDLDILDEGVRTINDDVEVFEAISDYLNLEPSWFKELVGIVK